VQAYSIRPQYASDFAQGLSMVLHVFKNLIGDHAIKKIVFKWEFVGYLDGTQPLSLQYRVPPRNRSRMPRSRSCRGCAYRHPTHTQIDQTSWRLGWIPGSSQGSQ
jgi:hypothetical protein